MKTKQFKEDVITGQVISIHISQTRDGSFVSAYYRHTNNRFQLDRVFPSIQSALNFVLKIIDAKPLAGLIPEYRAIPPIHINKTFRRSDNETHQHEQKAEQSEIS